MTKAKEWTPTHRFVGRTTMDGLANMTPVKIVGNSNGGRQVERYDGKVFIVGRHQVEKIQANP